MFSTDVSLVRLQVCFAYLASRHYSIYENPRVALKKAYSFGKTKFTPVTRKQTRDESVIIVDTFSTGAMLADALFKRGYKIICVLSGDLEGLLDMIPEGLEYSLSSTLVLNSSIEPDLAVKSLIEQLRGLGLPIVAVFAGAETGEFSFCLKKLD